MVLYLLRHGQADWPDWRDSDDKRPLTAVGQKETSQMVLLLRKLGAKPKLVVSSPLPRARETAEIAAKELNVPLQENGILSPGCSLDALRPLLKKHEGEEWMIVGHEPDFSGIVKSLTGARLKLAKSGVARVDIDKELDGKLIWLLTPQIAEE